MAYACRWQLFVLAIVLARPAFSLNESSNGWSIHNFPHPFNLASDHLRKAGVAVHPDEQNLALPRLTSGVDAIDSAHLSSQLTRKDEFIGCFVDSYGRGAGEPLQTCPRGMELNGALCYPACPSGYHGAGPVCWADCPSTFRDDGAYCAKPEAYGRGAGFAWIIFDGFSNQGMFDRCQAVHGPGNCEQCIAIVYPKCASNFHAAGCNICSPDCPSGWEDIGVSCHKPSFGRGWGTPMVCDQNYEQNGALCYEVCKDGFVGMGPVCWATTCPATYPEQCGPFCVLEGECSEVAKDVGIDTGTLLAGLLAATCVFASIVTWGAAAGCIASVIYALGGVVNSEEYLRTHFKYCYDA